MTKSPDAFRTISEVADWLGVQAHVLRFWESKFTYVKPVKRAGGRRYYRPSDMQLLGGIKKLLHDDGLTIKGVQKILREQGVAHVSALSQSLEEAIDPSEADTAIDSAVVNFPDRKTTEQSAAPETVVALVETSEPEPAEEPVTEIAETEEIAAKDDPPDSLAPETTTPPREPAEETALPSFMHRSTTDLSPPTADSETIPEPEPVATASPRPRIVEIADPPRETRIPYSPGPLTHLAGLDKLTADQASRIAPVAQQLSDWLARAGAPGAR